MEIEFLSFDGCQGQAKARPLLQEVLQEERITATVRFVDITSHEDALRRRFQGSPTIRINGRDLVEQPDADYGLRCRVYWVDGRPQDYPSKAMIRAALKAAAAAETAR